MVPLIVGSQKRWPESVVDWVKLADGPSQLNSNTKREGLVVRSSEDDSISFKVISNEFLLKEKD